MKRYTIIEGEEGFYLFDTIEGDDLEGIDLIDIYPTLEEAEKYAKIYIEGEDID